jgi:ATP-dependent Clp protease ATP-binding subunit ClpA
MVNLRLFIIIINFQELPTNPKVEAKILDVVIRKFKVEFFNLIKIVKFRNCDVIIKVVNNMVEKENNDIRQHNHQPMSNCEISVMSKIEDLKCKICSDANINVRMTYFSIYEDLLKTFRQLELDQYWKEWDNIKASLYHHRRMHQH